MKLRTKIQLFSSLFMFLLILLINTSIYYLFYNISSQSELDELSEQTNTIVSTLQANPDIPNKELLNAFLPQNGMIRIYTEQESEPILLITKDSEYRHLPGEFASYEQKKIIKNDDNIHIAVISKPIIWENGEVVTLEVSEYLITLKRTMTTLFYVLSIASLLMLLPTVIGSTILGRFLLGPIKTLTNTMRENIQHRQWKKINLQSRSRDELYEMEETFNDLIDELKNNFEKQEMFVSNASHELKTPISIVKSYAQLLNRRGKDHPQVFEESVQAIESEADRMQKLVEQLLMLAKSENEASYEIINVIALCEKVIQRFKGAYQRNIHLQKPPTPLWVNGNEAQLQQIIYILIDNGLKYSEQDININIFEYEDKAILQVIDFGQGIPEEDQKHIFDRFYRLDKARSRETGGTGLGLAIAKAITDAHGGRIFVKSKVDEGTTFTLELPSVDLVEDEHDEEA